MKKNALNLLFFLFWFFPISGFAIEDYEQQFEYALVTGITGGALNVPGRDEQIILGGIPLNLRMIYSHNSSIDSVFQFGMLLDFGNAQIVKNSGEAGFSWHLLGSSKKIKRISAIGVISGSSPYNISLPLRLMYSHYSISSKEDYLDRVSGSTLDIKTGLLARFDFFQDYSLEFEILVTALSFPSSVERLSYSGVDLNLIWRMNF